MWRTGYLSLGPVPKGIKASTPSQDATRAASACSLALRGLLDALHFIRFLFVLDAGVQTMALHVLAECSSTKLVFFLSSFGHL